MFDKYVTKSFLYAFQKGCTELALAVCVLQQENERLESRISELDKENQQQAENNCKLCEGIEKMLCIYSVIIYRKRSNFCWGLIFVGKHPHEN